MTEDNPRDDTDYEGSEYDQSQLKDRGSMGGAPDMPASGTGVLEHCRDEREGLTPKETALCAGLGLAEHSENEEDGGS
jgi:hypothetical protein